MVRDLKIQVAGRKRLQPPLKQGSSVAESAWVQKVARQ